MIPYNELTLAVVAQAAGLQHAGHPDIASRAHKVIAAVDRGVPRHRNPQSGEQCLLVQSVLRRFERCTRRSDHRQALERSQRGAGDVFPVEGQHVAARGEHGKLCCILEFAQ